MNICVGNTTTLTATPSGVWSSSNALIASVNASGEVTGVDAGNATITFTTSAGCYKTAAVTVNAVPSAITGASSLCDGTNTTLSATPSGGTWTSSTPAVASINAATGILTAVDPGVASITYETSPGCNVSTFVTVNASASAITGTAAVCIGDATTLNATPSGGVWSSSDTTVATIGDTSGVLTGLIAGTTTVTYQLGSGCYAVRQATVNELPTAITGLASICVSSSTELSSTPAGGVWTSSNGAVATVDASTGIVTAGGTTGFTTIEYTLATGCSTSKVVTVNTSPGSITGTQTVCMGSTTTLTASGGGTWSSSNTVKASVNTTTGVVTGLSAGTSAITYRVNSGCYTLALVTVNALPAAITGATSVCEGLIIPQASTTAGGTWSSSNAALASVGSVNGQVTGIESGVVNISYTSSQGCSTYRPVSVNSTPDAITGTATLCAATTTTLSATPGGGAWTTSSPTIATVNAASGVVAGIAAGTANITYTNGGCYTRRIVTIYALPAVIGGTATVCENAATTLTNTTTGGTWSSADAGIAFVTSANGIVTGISAGNVNITYQSALGCIRTKEVTVNVSPSAITGASMVCIGNFTTLNATPSGGVWSSSLPTAGSINAATGVVRGNAAGTANISYLVGGCRSTKVVTVNSIPTVITGTLLVCVDNIVTLASTPVGGTWSSLDTNYVDFPASNGNAAGIAPGTATVVYTGLNTCTRTAVVTVNPAVTANVGNPLLCLGQPLSVTVLTNPTTGGTWASSNASMIAVNATSGIMRGMIAGNATITYRKSVGCYATTVATVAAAIPAITGNTNICVGAVANLANGTSGGTWSSSTPTKASVNAATGEVTGIAAGTTTLTYTVSNACYKTAVQTVLTSPGTISGLTSVVAGTTIALTCSPAGGTWSTTAAGIASVLPTTGIVSGINSGSANISYQLSNGCRSIHSITILAGKAGETINDADNAATASDIRFFPNPTTGALTIESATDGEFFVISVDGKMIANYTITGGATTINLPNTLTPGIYVGRFIGKDGSQQMIRFQLN